MTATSLTIRLAAVDTLLFDLDGTVIDTFELIYRSFRQALRELLQVELPLESFRAVFGLPLREQVQEYTQDPALTDQLVNRYRALYMHYHDDYMAAYPGALEALAEFHRRGYALGVVTSKNPDTTLRALEQYKLQGLMDVVLDVSSTSRHKPHPEPILEALRRLDKRPEQVAMVGDSRGDVQSALAAGVLAVGVTWGPIGAQQVRDYGAELLVSSFDELLGCFPGPGAG